MVVDTSALIAILWNEPEAESFARLIAYAQYPLLSAVNYMEVSIVLGGGRGNSESWSELDAMMARRVIDVVAMDRDMALIARDAFLKFGKGRHPAALNMGDCAAYALARSRDLPLLFKGNDFSLTDIRAAA